MAPSLREIRQALTRKRKVERNGAPAERRAVAKIAKRAKAEGTEAAEPLCEEAAGSKADSAIGDKAIRADAGEGLGRSEAGGGNQPHSPSPVPLPSVIIVDLSPERDVEIPPPGAMEAEPAHSTTRPTPEAVPPPQGAENEVPLPAKVPDEGESKDGSSPAATKSLEGDAVDPSFQSVLRCSRWAEETLNLASVPEIQGFLQHQKRATFFREASVAHLWVNTALFSTSFFPFLFLKQRHSVQALNSLIAMKGLWAASEVVLDQSREEMGALLSRAERAEMALEDTRATTARALQAEVEAARLRAEKAEDALEVAQRQAANELDNAQVAEEKQKLTEEKLKTSESEVCLLKHQLHSATIEIGVAKERAENAEEIARRSEAHIVDLKAAVVEAERKTTEAEEKVAEAEQKASEAEKRATEAVEEFRKSAAYNKELAESTAFAYEGGFQECKEKVQRLYSLKGIEDLEPDEVPEDDDSTPHDH